MKLSFKFILVVCVLLGAALGGGTWLFLHNQQEFLSEQQQALQRQREAMEQEVKRRASIVAAFGESARDYTQKVLSPAVDKHIRDTIIFEAQSRTFVARGTFEQFRQKPGMKDYSFREASLNPLNRESNLADADETNLVHRFAADRNLKELSGFTRKIDRELFYVARPIVVEKSCLRCHDTPERAPKEVVARYGSQSGFGWKEGEINSVLMVSVPADDLRQQTAHFEKHAQQLEQQQAAAMQKALLMFVGVAVVLLLLLFVLFEVLVKRRLHRVMEVMEQVSANPTAQIRIPPSSGDEIGAVATTFNGMADSLRESHLKLEERVNERTAELARAKENLESQVADRQRAEREAVRAKAAAEAADHAKSQFLAKTTERVRLPLKTVLNNIDLSLSLETRPKQQEALKTIQTSVQSVLTAIQDMAEIAQLETGEIELKTAAFNPHDVLQQALAGPALMAKSKGLSVTSQVVASVPTSVVGDGLRLRQVLSRLLDNAVRFTTKGEVKAHIDVVSRTDREAILRFSVRDSGPGIASWKKDNLFGSDTAAGNGSHGDKASGGTGLTIAARLVHLLGGELQLDSRPSMGSTFSFTISVALPTGAKTLALSV